jgi:hypothetical protein
MRASLTGGLLSLRLSPALEHWPGRCAPASVAISTGTCRAVIKAITTDHMLDPSGQFGARLPKWVGSAITDRSEVTVTISVNEQVPGHKVTVRPAGRTKSGQRRASCECGWESRIGSTEQVMPEIRTHLEAALAAPQPPVGPPTEPGSSIFRP